MMNLSRNSKEEELLHSLKSFEVTPPEGLWDDIEATLLAKRRRKIIIITSWASAATVALLFSIGGFYTMNNRIETITSSEAKISNTYSTKPTKELNEQQINSNFIANRSAERSITADLEQKVVYSSQGMTLRDEFENQYRNDDVPEMVISIQPTLNNPKLILPNWNDFKLQVEKMDRKRAFAMAEPDEKKAKGDWFFSAGGFPVYSFHTAGLLNNPSTHQEAGIVSWGGSLSVRYALSKKISLETGVTYNILGQQEKNIYLVTADANNSEVSSYSGISNSYGRLTVSDANVKVMDMSKINILSFDAVNRSNFSKVDALQRFRYLEIPILFARGFYVKGINLNLKAGLSTGILIGNRLDLRGEKLQLKGKTLGVDPFVSSALASFGFSIPIANRTNFLVEPTFKLGLNALSPTNGRSYPFSTYIKFGIEVPL